MLWLDLREAAAARSATPRARREAAAPHVVVRPEIDHGAARVRRARARPARGSSIPTARAPTRHVSNCVSVRDGHGEAGEAARASE
jgi:hypothetical protein